MIERESLFRPILLAPEEIGAQVELVGESEVDGIAAIELGVTLAGGAQERWFLDADTFLEVAIESNVHDFTQSREPVRQRIFYDDFRDVGGVRIPHRLEIEFGHRLETMTVESAEAGAEVEGALFSPPVAAAAPAEE